MIQKTLYAMSCLALLMFINWSVPSTQGKEAPRLRYYGLLKTSNKEYPVDKVTIGGLYENIPFYGIPPNMDISPTADPTFLDLDDIVSIEPAFPTLKENLRSYKGREYVEVKIVEKGSNTPRHYLVEKERKIFCEEITAGAQHQREPHFEALQRLTIQGLHRAPETPREPTLAPTATKASELAKRNAVCTDVKKELDILPKTVSQPLINSIKNKIDYLCS